MEEAPVQILEVRAGEDERRATVTAAITFAAMRAIFLALFFLLLNTGPLNAAIVNSVGAPIRATAIAVNVFVIHILGDVPSPPLIGYISDKTGSLPEGFIVAVIAVAISAGILFFGSRYAPQVPQSILNADRATA